MGSQCSQAFQVRGPGEKKTLVGGNFHALVGKHFPGHIFNYSERQWCAVSTSWRTRSLPVINNLHCEKKRERKNRLTEVRDETPEGDLSWWKSKSQREDTMLCCYDIYTDNISYCTDLCQLCNANLQNHGDILPGLIVKFWYFSCSFLTLGLQNIW